MLARYHATTLPAPQFSFVSISHWLCAQIFDYQKTKIQMIRFNDSKMRKIYDLYGMFRNPQIELICSVQNRRRLSWFHLCSLDTIPPHCPHHSFASNHQITYHVGCVLRFSVNKNTRFKSRDSKMGRRSDLQGYLENLRIPQTEPICSIRNPEKKPITEKTKTGKGVDHGSVFLFLNIRGHPDL